MSFLLSVTIKSFMLNVIMLIVVVLNVIMLIVVMLSVIMLSTIMHRVIMSNAECRMPWHCQYPFEASIIYPSKTTKYLTEYLTLPQSTGRLQTYRRPLVLS
jgi:hypothetical protein